jgi:hypothetical protein
MPSLCCSFELPLPSITNRSCCVSAVLSLSEAALYQKVKFLPHRPGTRFTRSIGTPRPVFPISHFAVIGTYPRPNPIDPHARDPSILSARLPEAEVDHNPSEKAPGNNAPTAPCGRTYLISRPARYQGRFGRSLCSACRAVCQNRASCQFGGQPWAEHRSSDTGIYKYLYKEGEDLEPQTDRYEGTVSNSRLPL